MDASADEIEVEVCPAQGELWSVCPVDLDQARPGVDTIMETMPAAELRMATERSATR